ncbi:MAG: TIGR00341 family protein [Deltaproteobacteria bacterium]|nr:MAG: TIGR00341 family protein [Deltaproteobacteria bacterium]
MPTRLMQIILPENISNEDIPPLLSEENIITGWSSDYPDGKKVLHLLLPAEKCEAVFDKFERTFMETSGYNIILLPVEAILPRPKTEEPEEKLIEEKQKNDAPRVSREELYADINEGIKISRNFMAMTILSAIVAAIGLIRNDLAVIIGAMVIAPLLTPNVALALATTLGDTDLLRDSLKTGLTAISTAAILSVITGMIFDINPEVPAIASRTKLGMSDLILALASGCAGTFAFTSGVSAVLIGVMVAVALMPPLVVSGLLLGAGYFNLAYKALFLLMANIICVNLSGVVTFFIQGVRPGNWWEAKKAKKSARKAALLWTFLLIILIIIISFGKSA